MIHWFGVISGEVPLSSLSTDEQPPRTAIERSCSKLTKLLSSLKTLWKKKTFTEEKSGVQLSVCKTAMLEDQNNTMIFLWQI